MRALLASILFALAPSTANAQAQPSSPAPAADCLRNGETIVGEIRRVETVHSAGHEMRYLFLVLDEPRCVRDFNGRDEGRWVQLSFRDPSDAARLGREALGKIATVQAEYATTMTAWHIGDILATDAVVIEVHDQ